jgi:hypothetical protein
MAKRQRESLYYGLLEGESYILVKATSAQQAIANVQRQYPECDRVVSEKDFDDKTYTEEVLRIKVENQAEFDDF